MDLDQFEELVLHRSAVRTFAPDIVSRELVERLLRITQRAPSGLNLQPTHFYVVRQQQVKEQLLRACMGQKVILSAQTLVVFTGDRDASKHHFERVLEDDIRLGAVPEEKRDFYHNLCFSTKPLGFGWLVKLCLTPLLRLFTPVPDIPAVNKRAWLELHVGLSAMTFMLAAESAGLATCPISSCDEGRVKRVLGIPRRYVAPLIVAVGYPAERPPVRSRLPFEEIVHWS
jgi:putative NAD(P)H nitroreductase